LQCPDKCFAALNLSAMQTPDVQKEIAAIEFQIDYQEKNSMPL
jgi:hypothetical protein